MTPEQQQYIDDMRDLFVTEGWKWIETDCKGMIQMYKDVDGVETESQLQFAKGVLFAMRSILSLPDQIKDAEEADETD